MTDVDSDNQPSCSYLDSDSSDHDSCVEIMESTSSPMPKKAKKSKFTGAAKYRMKFNADWIKEFPFITSVPSDPYRLHSFLYNCCICSYTDCSLI